VVIIPEGTIMGEMGEKGSGEMRNKSQIKNKIQAVFDYPT